MTGLHAPSRNASKLTRPLIAAIILTFSPGLGWAQKPVINDGGVVSAASFTASQSASGSIDSPVITSGLAAGSIASIFGANLASVAVSASVTPLPRQLGGASVSVNGIAAPLFYVSPGQINFQIPTVLDTTPGASSAPGLVVTTAAGDSSPYPLGVVETSPEIFTMDGSGCGPGAVLNVSPSGVVSLNSPANSASPGDFIAIYGTGNGFDYNMPPDGTPSPTYPLASEGGPGSSPWFDFVEDNSFPFWEGLAPGLVGVNQFNFKVPQGVREGCSVPLQLENNSMSRPVTISIHTGGGQCVDPPAASDGQILIQKSVTTSLLSVATETDSVTVSLQASPGRPTPAPTPVLHQDVFATLPPTYTEGTQLPHEIDYVNTPSCGIPGYRSLSAGAVTIQGPSIAATPIPTAPLALSPVTGLSVYQATLPQGAIQPGPFIVAATGGTDVGAFQSTLQVGAPITVLTRLSGLVLQLDTPYTISWTGGDANSWVTLRLEGAGSDLTTFPNQWVARATDGSLTIEGFSGSMSTGFAIVGMVDIVIDVVPDPSLTPGFSATGLTHGGLSTWKYTYRFQGVTVN